VIFLTKKKSFLFTYNISGLVRLLHHSESTSRIATIVFNATDGFWGL